MHGQEPVSAPDRTGPRRTQGLLWLVALLLLVAAGLYVFKSIRDLPGEVLEKTGSAIHQAREALIDVVGAFSRKTVTTSFVSYASSVSSSHFLQFATLRQTEVFTQTDSASTGFGHIPLPDVIVEARAPVEYTYYLDLNAKWELVLREGVIYVFAPPIRFNKPAVDASEIKYEIRKDSLFRSSAQARQNLQKSITFLAQLRAKENTALVRETGRRRTAEFVEKWLAKSFSDGAKYPVKVFFPDEPEAAVSEVLPPSSEQGLRDRR